MEELQMLTQEEVASLLHTHVTTITTLRELNIIPVIKTGRNFMFSRREIELFQSKFRWLDVSNRVKAMESMRIVNQTLTVH